jgi:hypothetical protein
VSKRQQRILKDIFALVLGWIVFCMLIYAAVGTESPIPLFIGVPILAVLFMWRLNDQ